MFGHEGVATAYVHRPPYPDEVFELLEGLITDEPRTVLDLGAGDGALARPLAPRVDRVDAVDISAAMIAAGRTRPGGDRSNLNWISGAAETVPLDGPYALVTAGASLHWMKWEETFDLLARVMTPQAQFVIVEHGPRNAPWNDDLMTVIRRHSRNQFHDPDFSMVDALQERGLFSLTGTTETQPVVFRQAVADYVEQFHSTSTLAREHMTPEESSDFDRAVAEVVRPWSTNDTLDLPIVATLTWGRPTRPAVPTT